MCGRGEAHSSESQIWIHDEPRLPESSAGLECFHKLHWDPGVTPGRSLRLFGPGFSDLQTLEVEGRVWKGSAPNSLRGGCPCARPVSALGRCHVTWSEDSGELRTDGLVAPWSRRTCGEGWHSCFVTDEDPRLWQGPGGWGPSALRPVWQARTWCLWEKTRLRLDWRGSHRNARRRPAQSHGKWATLTGQPGSRGQMQRSK